MVIKTKKVVYKKIVNEQGVSLPDIISAFDMEQDDLLLSLEYRENKRFLEDFE